MRTVGENVAESFKDKETDPDARKKFIEQQQLNTLRSSFKDIVSTIPKNEREGDSSSGHREAIGRTEVLQETPDRAAKAFLFMTEGYDMSPYDIISGARFREQGYDGLITVKNIEFFSICEHHLLPFYGQCTIGYIPSDGVIIGLSKLPRIVDCFSRRLQVQERLTFEIAHCLQTYLEPVAAGVVIHAKHLCMMARGVEKQQSETTTSTLLGKFLTDDRARNEFLSFVDKPIG